LKSTPNRILFITQWAYEDPLVQTYTLPYVSIIKRLTGAYCYVVTVNNTLSFIKVKKIKDIISIQIPSGKRFFFLGWVQNILALRKLIAKKRIAYVHPWCTPAGAIGVILKVFNKNVKLTIDSFEPHAEAMVENKTWTRSGLKYKALFYFEKLEARLSNNLVFAAPGMEDYIREKYKVSVSNYSVKPACINLNEFSFGSVKNRELLQKYSLNDKIVCAYAGKFGGIYLEDETFAFIGNCEKYWGEDKFRFLLLSNVSNEYVHEKAVKHGIKPGTIVKLFVPHKEVPQYMGMADFAICPVKPVPTKKYCTPIKNGEYWAMGLPVVIPPNISVDSDIIKENNAGTIIESFDDNGYSRAVKQIDTIINGKSRAEVYEKIRPLAEKYRNFSIAEKVYSQIYK